MCVSRAGSERARPAVASLAARACIAALAVGAIASRNDACGASRSFSWRVRVSEGNGSCLLGAALGSPKVTGQLWRAWCEYLNVRLAEEVGLGAGNHQCAVWW